MPTARRLLTIVYRQSRKDEMLPIELPDWGIQLVIEPLTDTLGVIRGLGRNTDGAVQIVMADGQEHIQLWRNLYKR